MKKIMVIVIMLVLISFFVVAKGPQGIHEPGTGVENPEIKEAGQGTGQSLQAEQRAGVQTCIYMNRMGKQMRIQQQADNRFRLEAGNVSVDCPFNLTQEQFQNRTRLYAKLSNGRNAEIKVMPDTASETALQRWGLRNCNEKCNIELKEAGYGNQVHMDYEVKSQRNSKLFGLFRTNMNVQSQVDAETGEVIKIVKPWWAFLATG